MPSLTLGLILRHRFRMREIGKAAAIIAAVAALTGCRVYEEQKTALVQTVSAAMLTPFVDAQKTTTLTQGTFKRVATVAPQKIAHKPLPKLEKVEPMLLEQPSKCTCVTRKQTMVRG